MSEYGRGTADRTMERERKRELDIERAMAKKNERDGVTWLSVISKSIEIKYIYIPPKKIVIVNDESQSDAEI